LPDLEDASASVRIKLNAADLLSDVFASLINVTRAKNTKLIAIP